MIKVHTSHFLLSLVSFQERLFMVRFFKETRLYPPVFLIYLMGRSVIFLACFFTPSVLYELEVRFRLTIFGKKTFKVLLYTSYCTTLGGMYCQLS